MFGEGGLAIPCHFAAAAAFFPPPRNSELRKRRLRSLAGLGWDSSVCVCMGGIQKEEEEEEGALVFPLPSAFFRSSGRGKTCGHESR